VGCSGEGLRGLFPMIDNNDQKKIGKFSSYPMLESLLSEKGLSLKGMYTYPDLQEIFGCSKRALQAYVHDGKLNYRNLPGRGHWLSGDLEEFLRHSIIKK
jgi:hypothetical protein